MRKTTKQVLVGLIAVTAGSLMLTACNTVQGVGRDIQAVGTPDRARPVQTTTVRSTEVVTTPQQY
jgi:predicted small secreted protein